MFVHFIHVSIPKVSLTIHFRGLQDPDALPAILGERDDVHAQGPVDVMQRWAIDSC